jgi:hypothetical protein
VGRYVMTGLCCVTKSKYGETVMREDYFIINSTNGKISNEWPYFVINSKNRKVCNE